jgi:hypothetical protein
MTMENNSQKPSAALTLILAFAVPAAVFIGIAMGCKYLLEQYIRRDDLRTAVSFLVAAAATFAILHTVRRLLKHN